MKLASTQSLHHVFAPAVRPSIVRGFVSRALNAVRLRRHPHHRRRVDAARRALDTIRTFDGARRVPKAFAYLRKLDPFVFEEVVLTGLEDAGAIVIRSRRYTGDSGCDGRFWHPGMGTRLGMVQVKRYASSIDPVHVESFARLLADSDGAPGLFVHSGRTGLDSYRALAGQALTLVSGDRLLDLLVERRWPVASVTRRNRRGWTQGRPREG